MTLALAWLTSVTMPSGLIATSESRLDSVIARAASNASISLVTSWVMVEAPTLGVLGR